MTTPHLPMESATVPASRKQAAELVKRASACLERETAPVGTSWVAKAPGRLDVMGGIAEYTGALTLGSPMNRHVWVTVQQRADRRVVVYDLDRTSSGGHDSVTFDLSILNDGGGAADGPGVARHFEGPASAWATPVAGALYALRVSGKTAGTECGLEIGVDNSLPLAADAAGFMSVAVAVLQATSRAWDLHLDPIECAHLALRSQNDVVGMPCGISAAMCALHGTPDALTQVSCQTNELAGFLSMPEGALVVGIDCGMKHSAALERYVHARVAAFMGRLLVDRIISAQNGNRIRWSGSLALLSVNEYVDFLRDRIPTRIKGAEFLDRFGETGDPLTRIAPDSLYKIRSRTEHHVYEGARTLRFAERLARAARTHDRQALVEAGELMHASHWSYGQRCGLGSIETDRLVNVLRAQGPQAGIYGARVSACGSGGLVVVLMSNSPKSRDALELAIQQYERATSCSATVLEGGSSGALHFGVQEIRRNPGPPVPFPPT